MRHKPGQLRRTKNALKRRLNLAVGLLGLTIHAAPSSQQSESLNKYRFGRISEENFFVVWEWDKLILETGANHIILKALEAAE